MSFFRSTLFVCALFQQAISLQWPSISILTPTCLDRHWMHPTLLKSFQSQTYPGELELIVYDGPCKRANAELSDAPSPFLVGASKSDARVVYTHNASETPTIGEKRAKMAAKATGDLIAHFDDDDYYSPTYLETMVRKMMDEKADLVKLHAWTNYGDMRMDGVLKRKLAKIDYSESYMRTGFGFTVVFKKAILEDVPYSVLSEREDSLFVAAVTKADRLDEEGQRQKMFKVHLFEAKDPCLVLRVVCNSVHRFAGMPDPEHLANAKLSILDDEDAFFDTCADDVDLDAYLEKVDYAHEMQEGAALALFAKEQEQAKEEPQAISHHGHDEL